MAQINTSFLGGPSIDDQYGAGAFVFEGDLGFAPFLEKVLNSTNLPADAINLGVTITSVVRPAAGAAGATALAWTSLADQSNVNSCTCGAVLNTAPQTVGGLSFLGLDSVEAALFTPVFTNRYATAAVTGLNLPVGSYTPGVAAQLEGPVALAAASQARPGLMGALRSAAAAAFDFLSAWWQPAPTSPSLGEHPASPLLSLLDDPKPRYGQPISLTIVQTGAANLPPGTDVAGFKPSTGVTYALSVRGGRMPWLLLQSV